MSGVHEMSGDRKDEAPACGAGPGEHLCLSRRALLLGGGAMVSVVALGGVAGVSEAAAPNLAMVASYPKRHIGRLAALKVGQPVVFSYPYPNVSNLLVKLGVLAGGGVGPDGDVVAFNQTCTHMGGPLQGTYKPNHQVLGPCSLHLTTFDLTRHGMVASGHATESLPQIVLETDGDQIFAVGVMGLIYGYASNLAGRRSA